MNVRELLEQFGGATFLDRGAPVYHEVLAQTGWTDLAPLEGDRHAFVAANA
jgi:hypothetical protein